MSQGRNESRSIYKSRGGFDRVFLMKRPCEINEMFQVLYGLSRIFKYRVAFLFDEVQKLLVRDLRVKDFFDFILNFFVDSNER